MIMLEQCVKGKVRQGLRLTGEKRGNFRIPNLDPDTPAQGGTFAPGDLLPTKNNR